VTEVSKDETSIIPRLLDLNLEESHKTWGDAVEDALKLQEDESRNKAGGARDDDWGHEVGSLDLRRYDSGRNRGEISRVDDRPPAKKLKDEPSSYRSQRDDGYGRDRTRGQRGRGKVDTFRSGAARGSRSSANDYRSIQSRDNVVSEYQPGRRDKRGTLTFERSDLHPDRQTSFENKRGQFRFGDSGSRHGREERNREGRGKDGRENSFKKDERISTNKLAEAPSASETVVSSASGAFPSSTNREPTRTNAWSQPLHGPKQGSDPTRSDETPDANQWTAGTQPPSDSALSQQEGTTDNDAFRQNSADSLQHKERPEIDSRLVESQGYDKQSRKQAGSRAESSRVDYRSDRGRRQSRRGRRQDWPDQADGGERVQRYTRRYEPRGNKESRGPRTEVDVSEEPDEAMSREDRNQSEGRRTSRYGSGGRGLRQSYRGEYSVRSRGRGVLRFHMSVFFYNKLQHTQPFFGCFPGFSNQA